MINFAKLYTYFFSPLHSLGTCTGDSGRANPNIFASLESAGSHVVESSLQLMVYKVSDIFSIMQTQVASMSQ